MSLGVGTVWQIGGDGSVVQVDNTLLSFSVIHEQVLLLLSYNKGDAYNEAQFGHDLRKLTHSSVGDAEISHVATLIIGEAFVQFLPMVSLVSINTTEVETGVKLLIVGYRILGTSETGEVALPL